MKVSTPSVAKIDNSLTETSVEQFKDFMKFIGDNNLWDEVEQCLKADGISNVVVSSLPIQSIRRLITEKLLKSDRLARHAHAQAAVIARCGCGVTSPGPGHTPVSPGGGGDAGPEAGSHPM